MKSTLSFLSVILAMSTASACADADQHDDHSAPAAVRVSTASATVATVPDRLEAGGVIAARESAVLSSRIMASILEVQVRAGDRVRTGDLLVRLDARDVAALAGQASASADAAEKSLRQARSAREAAEADHKLASAWHARISTLYSKKSATAQERDDADARVATTAARLATADATIEAAQAVLTAARAGAVAAATTESFTAIRAPFDGVVAERFVDPGTLAVPGTPLVHLESTGERRVEVTVDEARATFIKPGDRVEIEIEGPGAETEATPIEATVSEITRVIAADRRAFTVKVALPTADTVRTGTFARMRFRGAARRALVVPASAVRRQGHVTSVFVVLDNTALLRLVQTGNTTPEGVVVLAGLDAGEVVITSPPPQLRDAHPVIVGSTQSGVRQ